MLSDSIIDKVEEDQGAAHGQTMLKGAIPDSTTIWSVCPEVDPEHAGVITSAWVNTQGPPEERWKLLWKITSRQDKDFVMEERLTIVVANCAVGGPHMWYLL